METPVLDVGIYVGDMVSWKKCKKKVFGEIVSMLEDSVLIQQFNEYGDFTDLDVVKLNEIKKDTPCFLTREYLSTEYFDKSINFFS
jgi:hypothetical protein